MCVIVVPVNKLLTSFKNSTNHPNLMHAYTLQHRVVLTFQMLMYYFKIFIQVFILVNLNIEKSISDKLQ